MNLNRKGRNELRNKVEEELKNVPDEEKIHLSKELLEDLLFETIVFNKKTQQIVKLPVWSGDFLRKIDLSGISFENVSWNLLYVDDFLSSDYDLDDKDFDELIQKVKEIQTELKSVGKNKIIYSNTNAKIDLKKSFEYINKGKAILNECDFSGTDLSNSDIDDIFSISYCNLSNTGLNISSFNRNRFRPITEVNFSGLDLRHITIGLIELFNDEFFDSDCTFKNTGLKITASNEEIESIKQDGFGSDLIKDLIESEQFVGCYINDKLIHSKKEQQIIANKNYAEYEKFKQERINSAIAEINDQITKKTK